jgi:hypothetical protein
MIKQTAIACLAGIALASCTQEGSTSLAGADERSGRQCFAVGLVSGFEEGPEDDTVIIRVGVNDRYLFQTFGPCPDLDFAQALALDVRPGSFVCDALDVNLIVPSPTLGPDRCPVRLIRKLSEAEVEAL